MDRSLAITLILSVALHGLIVGAELASKGWQGFWAMSRPLKIVYDDPATKDSVQRAQQELRQLESRLVQMGTTAPVPSGAPWTATASLGGTLHRGAGGELAQALWKARIPDAESLRSSFSGSSSSTAGGAWAAAIDLTNLAEAAHGNPVLLSYFNAIREQIQRTANERSWVAKEQAANGMIYVGFIVTRTGQVESASVIAERSASSPALRQIAVQMIEAASPFPPFPPSFIEPSKALVVPIEFVLGS